MKHIALIGIDGSGKSTLANNLLHYLEDVHKYKVLIARSDKINSGILKEICEKHYVGDNLRLTAYALDLALKYQQLVNKKDINFIIWDRYYYCLLAYFSALNTDLDNAIKITSIMPIPDYTFLLEVDESIALERIRQREKAQKSDENSEYLMAVQREYIELLKDSNILRIDSSRSQEEILHSVVKYIL